MMEIPFTKIDWQRIKTTEHKGEKGSSVWKTLSYEGLRIRIVEYKAGYLADHWCSLGHIVHCLEGAFFSELSTGEKIKLEKGDTYVVSNDLSSHRSYAEINCKLLIVDGDFLTSK